MDLSTLYMGLRLRNPLVASASPLSNTLDGIRQLADAGVGAIVLPSLFEEQVREQAVRDSDFADRQASSFHETLGFFPAVAVNDAGPRRYLSLLRHAVAAVDVPVISSLNGVTPEGWTGFAREMQAAGAAAIELNVYYLPANPSISGREVEQRHVDIVEMVKEAVSVPVAVKLGPGLSSVGEVVMRLDAAGADALVLFNRFLYPDIDPEGLGVVSEITLSSSADARQPRIWIALLRRTVAASLAATTGVENSGDVVSYLLAGADVVMTTSALLRHGPAYATVLLDGLEAWMSRKRFDRVDDFRAMLSVPADSDATTYERAGYVRAMRIANVRDSWAP